MSDPLFPEGGPFNIKPTESDQYHFDVPIPRDETGMAARECVDSDCAPGYFKIRPGTGVKGEQPEAYCPYCRSVGKPSDFHTESQKEYARNIVLREAADAVADMVHKAFGIGPSGRRDLSTGMLKLSVSYQGGVRQTVHPPVEDEFSRELICPFCTLEHAVYGLAFWCPDCGQDVFLTHVRREIESIKQALAAIPTRREALGVRVAARDLENALEDVVSVFEGAGKQVLWRRLREMGKSREDAADVLSRRVRNQLQNIATASDVFTEFCGFDPLGTLGDSEREALESAFMKRHPITHNLGIVDRKYLARAQSLAEEGKELRVSPEDVSGAANIVVQVIESLHRYLYPSV